MTCIIWSTEASLYNMYYMVCIFQMVMKSEEARNNIQRLGLFSRVRIGIDIARGMEGGEERGGGGGVGRGEGWGGGENDRGSRERGGERGRGRA